MADLKHLVPAITAFVGKDPTAATVHRELKSHLAGLSAAAVSNEQVSNLLRDMVDKGHVYKITNRGRTCYQTQEQMSLRDAMWNPSQPAAAYSSGNGKLDDM